MSTSCCIQCLVRDYTGVDMLCDRCREFSRIDRLESLARRMTLLEDFIRRMEQHSATQIDVSSNSPSWIGYHNAFVDCLAELERWDEARKDEK